MNPMTDDRLEAAERLALVTLTDEDRRTSRREFLLAGHLSVAVQEVRRLRDGNDA